MKKSVLILILSLILFFVNFTLEFIRYADAPATDGNNKTILMILPGWGLNKVTDALEEAGLVKSPLKFKLLAILNSSHKKIRAGEYQFAYSASPKEILDIMVSGKIYLHRVTIPEGYTLRQIAAEVAKTGLVGEKAFVTAAADQEFIRKKVPDAPSLEGYLFPDTYYFPKGVTAQSVLSAMTDRTYAVFRPEWRERAKEIGFSVHQILTLASVIEKETGLASERPIISSVFHNRLKHKMRLDSDPTVIYGIENFNGNITRKDLETPTPYNTYKIYGLPPGPIANPGASAIEAALYPDNTDFLYFVAKGDGGHQFSENLDKHRQAVKKYQIGKLSH